MREWLQQALQQSPLQEASKQYLLARGAKSTLIKRWGFCNFKPPQEDCPDPKYKNFGRHFEAFRNKLITPLWSPRGVLMGFDSRTPERRDLRRFFLPEAHWNPVWIGMPWAMPLIWDKRPIWVVEGGPDAFALKRVVKDPVLGSGPAGLSYNQIEFLKRWGGDVNFCLDRDKTGIRAARKAMKQLRPHGVQCRDIPFRGGKDPNSIYEKGGDEALERAFSRFLI